MRQYICVAIVLVFISATCDAQTRSVITPEFEQQHRQAVEQARQGNHDDALRKLNQLLLKNPTYYPVIRDYIIIASWADRCDLSLEYYKKINSYPDQEPYLILPVSECLVENGDLDQAKALLAHGRKKWPDDEDLKEADRDLAKQIKQLTRRSLYLGLENDNSQGEKAWRFTGKFTNPVNRKLSVYGRYYVAHSNDDSFDTEDMNRLGIGGLYKINRQFSLEQEFSTDVAESGEFGSRTKLSYTPEKLWLMNLEYSSYAEDLSLRAKAQGVDANRTSFDVDYHSEDYRWEWYGAYRYYRYSDANLRRSFYTQGSHAFEMTPKREQRIVLELDYSNNSFITDAVYFNPKTYTTLALGYKLDLILDTSYDRHVDTLYVYGGTTSQKGYSSAAIGGISYMQNYDFNETTSFQYGLGYNSRVFDGVREGDVQIKAYLTKQF